MYWPLGAPRSYAQQLPLELSKLSSDGLKALVAVQGRNTPEVVDKQEDSEETLAENGVGKGEQQESISSQGQENESSRHEEAQDSAHEQPGVADDGRVISMRASRHGHLFATITSSSLTVWQTQVRSAVKLTRHPS